MKLKTLVILALCLSAPAVWAADDLNLRFTKVDNDTIAYQSDIVSNNGKTTHWLKVWMNGVLVKSCSMNSAVAYIDPSEPVFGALAWTGGGGSGGGGNKYPHGPTGDGIERQWYATKLLNGIWYDETKTVFLNGEMHYSLIPTEQQDMPLPDGFISQLGEVEVTVTEEGGPKNGSWGGMKAWVPFAQSGSKIGVTHYFATGAYVVTSFTVNLGFISAKCSKDSSGVWKLNVDWEKSDG